MLSVQTTDDTEAIILRDGVRYVLDRNRGRWELSRTVRLAPAMSAHLKTWSARFSARPIADMIPDALRALASLAPAPGRAGPPENPGNFWEKK